MTFDLTRIDLRHDDLPAWQHFAHKMAFQDKSCTKQWIGLCVWDAPTRNLVFMLANLQRLLFRIFF